MKFFSDCSDCLACAGFGGCLAGHGDDDFVQATEKQLRQRLEPREYPLRKFNDREIQHIKDKLREWYGVNL